MLTTKDIEKLIAFLKEVFVTKEEMEEKFTVIQRSFSNLQSSVDGIVKEFKTNSEERFVLGDRVSRSEDWIEKAGSINA